MSRSEGIHNKNIAASCHSSAELIAVAFFSSKKSNVLHQTNLSFGEGFRLLDIFQKNYGNRQQLTEPLCDRS